MYINLLLFQYIFYYPKHTFFFSNKSKGLQQHYTHCLSRIGFFFFFVASRVREKYLILLKYNDMMYILLKVPNNYSRVYYTLFTQSILYNFFSFLDILSSLMLNYQLSQKLNLLGKCEFNHLIIIIIFLLTCGPKLLPLNKCGPICEIFNILNGRQSKTKYQIYDFLL